MAAIVVAAGCANKGPTISEIAAQPGSTPIITTVPKGPATPSGPASASGSASGAASTKKTPGTAALGAVKMPTCKGADPAVTAGPVSDEGDTRSVVIAVKNCTGEPLKLSAIPDMQATMVDGRTAGTSWQLDGLAPATLAPNAWTAVQLAWPATGTCKTGAQELAVTFGETTTRIEGCLRLGTTASSDNGEESPSPSASAARSNGVVAWMR